MIYQGARIDGEVYGRPSDAPWDSTTWDVFESHTGRRVSLVHFGFNGLEFYPGVLELARARGAYPFLSLDPQLSLAGVARGDFDAQIIDWATKVKAWGWPVFIRPWWEMNGDWYSWSRDPNYILAWRRFVDLTRWVGASNATFVWCVNTIYNDASRPIASWFPGANYVDWVGIDGYNANNPWRSPEELFEETFDKLKTIAPNKPVMLCETGAAEAGPGAKAAWITNLMTQYVPARGWIKAVCWFNWNVFENGVRRQWQIESSQSAQNAYNAAVHSPGYVGASANSTWPWLGKVPVP